MILYLLTGGFDAFARGFVSMAIIGIVIFAFKSIGKLFKNNNDKNK